MYIVTGLQHKRILRTMYSAVLCAVYSVGRKKEIPVPPGTFIFVNCFVSSIVHIKHCVPKQQVILREEAAQD